MELHPILVIWRCHLIEHSIRTQLALRVGDFSWFRGVRVATTIVFLKWLHNCTGSSAWCACNAKAEPISNKVSCEHPGGGRDEVCQWCTWRVAELARRTAAARCSKSFQFLPHLLGETSSLYLLLLSASSHGKLADSLCHPDLDFHASDGKLAC